MDISKRFDKIQGGCPSIQCEANRDVLCQTCAAGVVTAAHRVESRATEPCLFGKGGTCCRNCNMGPCQIIDGVPEMVGVCGADASTVVARNLARAIAGGAAAHIDHGRGLALAFVATAKGETPYEIKDASKLRQTALRIGINPEDKSVTDLAIEVGNRFVGEFGQQGGGLSMMKRAPKKRQEIWSRLGIGPRGIDREVVELMHRTHMGVDQDYRNILFQGARCALADGWGASMIATELSDIMFGTPVPIRTKVNSRFVPRPLPWRPTIPRSWLLRRRRGPKE
jgi:carbon-monoxide dehydrogenase catalytic subunit